MIIIKYLVLKLHRDAMMTVFFEVSAPNCSKLMKQAVTYCLRVCWQIHVGREGAVHPSVQTIRALGGREET
jgi:hypothetical protein